MVEIEEEELAGLRNRAGLYDNLVNEHENLKQAHNQLKDDYISICRGQQKQNNDVDDFDKICADKFDKK